MEEVNHVDKINFDKNLANIAPCTPAWLAYVPLDEALYSLKLHQLMYSHMVEIS